MRTCDVTVLNMFYKGDTLDKWTQSYCKSICKQLLFDSRHVNIDIRPIEDDFKSSSYSPVKKINKLVAAWFWESWFIWTKIEKQ